MLLKIYNKDRFGGRTTDLEQLRSFGNAYRGQIYTLKGQFLITDTISIFKPTLEIQRKTTDLFEQ